MEKIHVIGSVELFYVVEGLHYKYPYSKLNCDFSCSVRTSYRQTSNQDHLHLRVKYILNYKVFQESYLYWFSVIILLKYAFFWEIPGV